MTEPLEPTVEQCSVNAPVTVNGRMGAACWYPSMGGYTGKAVAVPAEDGCTDVWVWHDGEFPFPGEGNLDDSRVHSPVLVHYSDPGDLIRFGQFLEWLADEEDRN